MPAQQRLHGIGIGVLRQLLHEQRRGVCGFLRSLHGQPPQELAAHWRNVLVLQCRLGNQLLQPRLQDGTYALGSSGERNEDGQRSLPAHAGYHWNLLCLHGQAHAPSQHTQPAFLIPHSGRRHHVPGTWPKHHYCRTIPRHKKMAQEGRAPRRLAEEYCQLRLAVAILRGRDTEGQDHP